MDGYRMAHDTDGLMVDTWLMGNDRSWWLMMFSNGPAQLLVDSG